VQTVAVTTARGEQDPPRSPEPTGDSSDRPEAPPRGGEPARTTTFASLTNPTYRLLFVSGAVSFLAVQAQFVARGWLANDLTGTNAGLGAVYMAFGLAMLLATPFGGVLADRLSKRNILITTQVALGASALWIGLGVQFDFVQYWMVLVVSAVQGIGLSFLAPARMAMTSELVGRELLTNAIVLGQMSMNSTRVIGPALAGVGISVAWFGLAGVYYASAFVSALGFVLLLPLPTARRDRLGPPRSPAREFADGLRYVRRRTDIGWLVLTSFVVVMVAFPYVAFLPRVATEMFDVGAVGFGAMSAVGAVGAVLMSLYMARRTRGLETWRSQSITGFGFGVGLLLMAASPTYAVVLAAIFVVGASASGFQSMNNSLVLGLAEFEYHGRLQSLMMLSFSGFGMAALPLGLLADVIGLRATFVAMGSTAIAAMSVYLAWRPAPVPSP
jgi:predicted MFS family arabinose efflux permease